MKPNRGGVREGIGGTFGRFTMFNTATYQSYWIATTQRHTTSERSGKEERCKLVCEECAVRARAYCCLVCAGHTTKKRGAP